MNRADLEAMFFFTAAFAYVVGTLMGYLANLFNLQYGVVLIPIWTGLAYFFFKHRATYRSFFKAMWGKSK